MGEVNMNHVKPDPEFERSLLPHWEVWSKAHELNDNRTSNHLSNDNNRSIALESPAQDTNFYVSAAGPAPICRQFWKAGNYDDDDFSSKSRVQNSQNYLHVHPKFLHSNATSHKWAFGAIAELLDNAVEEIQNGATFVIIDKILNARDSSPALLIQDDGGGMDPEAIRRCMSFGFSDKKSKSAIGRYGNGFKTSTMRLGSDVIVFSRHMGNRTLTQSIGLLSYTYLSRTGLDRIVVPMVDYEYNTSTSTFEPVHRHGKEHFQSNMSIFLHWCPYSSELELLKQFDDIGSRGTKVIVYNLWDTNDETLELDFASDPEDIRLSGSTSSEKKMQATEKHMANQYRYSLRIPQKFYIILRGKVVEYQKIAQGLKFPEFILYKPQTGGTKEGEVLTTVGFLKEAPNVHIHGFNIYHKNRLVLPFWSVINSATNRGRGVVGVLEANFVEPIHNKQDFERTSLFQKLESRLKEMTYEYWDYHCGLIGYNVIKKARVSVSSSKSSSGSQNNARRSNLLSDPVISKTDGPVVQNFQSDAGQIGVNVQNDISLGRRNRIHKHAREGPNATSPEHPVEIQPAAHTAQLSSKQAVVVMNKKLRAECLELEKTEQELNHKLSKFMKELEEAKHEYARMFSELRSLDPFNPDNKKPSRFKHVADTSMIISGEVQEIKLYIIFETGKDLSVKKVVNGFCSRNLRSHLFEGLDPQSHRVGMNASGMHLKYSQFRFPNFIELCK